MKKSSTKKQTEFNFSDLHIIACQLTIEGTDYYNLSEIECFEFADYKPFVFAVVEPPSNNLLSEPTTRVVLYDNFNIDMAENILIIEVKLLTSHYFKLLNGVNMT